MSGLEFGGALDEHLLDGVDEDVCEACDEDPCVCEPDFEALTAAKAEGRWS